MVGVLRSTRWVCAATLLACGADPAATLADRPDHGDADSSGPRGADGTEWSTDGGGSTTDPGGASGGGSGGDDGAIPHEPLAPGVPSFDALPDVAVHGYVVGVYGPGIAWADLDGDGALDLFTTGGTAPSTIWRNQGGQLVAADVPGDISTWLDTAGVSTPDFDNDGDPDVYLLRRDGNRLLRNDGTTGELVFVDVTDQAGVGYVGAPASSTWGDFDGDGWLDLFVTTLGYEPDALYRSDGDGTFTECTALLPGMTGEQTFGASFVDLDDDGDVDLFAVNDKNAGNRMWRNDGPGCGGWCFTEVGALWGLDAQAFGMGLGVGDFDNDLDLDLSYANVDKHHLLRRDPGPHFVDVAPQQGVNYWAHGWGTVFFDADNDGWLDLFVADSQTPDAHSRLFHSEQGHGFTDVSAACGAVLPGWNYAVAHADFDQDGALDLAVGTRGFGTRVFRNLGSTHHWLEIELVGGGGVNRDAVGTRVVVETSNGKTLRRDVEIGSGLATQSSTRLHFGLGANSITAVEIRWPDGTIETPSPPPTDALWRHAHPG